MRDMEERKAWLLLDPVLARIFAEYKRRYGRIWLDGKGVQGSVQGVPPVPQGGLDKIKGL